jgi:hypothetical protein
MEFQEEMFTDLLTFSVYFCHKFTLNSILFLISGTLIGLFSQVRTGGDIVRDRALKFLHLKLKTEGNELISSKDTESILLQEIKLSIEECTADEFVMFMAMLGATSLPKTIRYFQM